AYYCQVWDSSTDLWLF
nr:immunoglobulin light chain junction region [Macaca mulatta]MOX16870.1 immunoglobulin light chain junction region [Macaca mulatta]MOX16908.1 immunoglobulin light chain junction region [Macaca mulatta]MOX16990.1 immunoglobulin light chain junction region [Macaca mulatta]MOX17018.1 immunoglobulin light chain junction region [Macaca mulatta]